MKRFIRRYRLKDLIERGLKPGSKFLCVESDEAGEKIFLYFQVNSLILTEENRVKHLQFRTCWREETLNFDLEEYQYLGSVKMARTGTGEKELRHVFYKKTTAEVSEIFNVVETKK